MDALVHQASRLGRFQYIVDIAPTVDERSSDPGYPQPLPYPSVIEMPHDYRVDIFRVDRTDPYRDSFQYGDIKLISDGYCFEVYY